MYPLSIIIYMEKILFLVFPLFFLVSLHVVYDW